jgi:hypothetical protein
MGNNIIDVIHRLQIGIPSDTSVEVDLATLCFRPGNTTDGSEMLALAMILTRSVERAMLYLSIRCAMVVVRGLLAKQDCPSSLKIGIVADHGVVVGINRQDKGRQRLQTAVEGGCVSRSVDNLGLFGVDCRSIETDLTDWGSAFSIRTGNGCQMLADAHIGAITVGLAVRDFTLIVALVLERFLHTLHCDIPILVA